MLRLLTSNLMIKVLIGAAVILAVLSLVMKPDPFKPCAVISHERNKSVVMECDAGFNTVALSNSLPFNVFAELWTSEPTQAWLTKAGDVETLKTLRAKLGPPDILGKGRFLGIASGRGLVYIHAAKQFVVTVVWNVPAK